MHDQPRNEPYEASRFFRDGVVSRAPPANTVARGDLVVTSSQTVPLAELLERGRDRYDIYCSPCHGYVGDGDGLVVQRGFKAPPSLHNDRLRTVPDRYIYTVITQGYGAMLDYAASVKPIDRWAIAAYIRALQRSQNFPVSELPEERRAALRGGNP